MKIVDLAQRSPEWHAWRRAGVTASDATVLLGSPYKTPWRLWAEKTGRLLEQDLSGNPNVQRGIREEPEARRRYEARHDVLLLPVCAESTEEPIVRASFDGLTDGGRPVELKAPTEDNFRDAVANGVQSVLYQLYYPQVQAQIYVSESDLGYLTLQCDDAFLDLEVPRDEDCIARLVEAARRFWECVRTGTEPPLDPMRDLYIPSGPDLEAWFRLAADYRQLNEKLASYAAETKAIEKALAELQRQLVEMMGEFAFAESSGIRISRCLQQGAIDYKAAVTEFLPNLTENDLKRFRRKPSERVRITVRAEDDKRTEVPFEPEALKKAAEVDAWF
ncbi:endonuclease [Methylocaldum sp. BRCS4]|jgi:putative phage-type endonuclease|uniref:YqaJ viral recombinase family nuclease n=1 Tax=Methylocaldum sp. GT1BB TaxID=3438963 RepID=UPI000A3214FB|nr:endonuclease [Methylocaldum sp. BRCS4]